MNLISLSFYFWMATNSASHLQGAEADHFHLVSSKCWETKSEADSVSGLYHVTGPQGLELEDGGGYLSIIFEDREVNRAFYKVVTERRLADQGAFRVRLEGTSTKDISRTGFRVFIATSFELLETAANSEQKAS